jgi:hypothetical protein
METKTCPQCGNKMFHNKGVSKKTGKPYENWKCGDKACGNIEWVDLKAEKEINREPNWSPKILKAEENAKTDQILEGIKTLHHNILCLNKKVNAILAKSGDIPVVDEVEASENVLDQDDLRDI